MFIGIFISQLGHCWKVETEMLQRVNLIFCFDNFDMGRFDMELMISFDQICQIIPLVLFLFQNIKFIFNKFLKIYVFVSIRTDLAGKEAGLYKRLPFSRPGKAPI